jgi:tryptophan-rich sensory protein
MAEIAIEIVELVLSILVCQIAGFVGSIFTVPSIPTWYRKLKKPSFAPPNRIFGPVWIILYTIMGVSLYLILREGLGNPQVQIGMGIFGIQLVLNVIWSFVFFEKKSIFGGLVTIIVLWIAILLTTISFINVSILAGLLLVPYILWSSFAAFLNYSILKLN